MADSLSLAGARWVLREVDEDSVRVAAERTGLPLPAARVLVSRRGQDGQVVPPSLDQLHDPLAMLHMEAALARLRRAVAAGEHVRIITDYDVDGTTSSLILQATLQLLGHPGALDYHIPDRFDEGYGFSVVAAEAAAVAGVSLVVTADIGVRDHAAIARAGELGVDVLVCDHHLPSGAEVPEGATVLCPPQRGCHYPNPHLAACGVSLKVAQALLEGHRLYEPVMRSLLKLAAIGTVADLVSLATAENRAIVALGLAELNRGPHHAGLAALLEVGGLRLGTIGTTDLGFRVGPRINAAGRVDKATRVVELLSCRDPEAARTMALELDQLNTQRRDIQRRLVEEALGRVGDAPDPFVVVAGPEEEGWHRGVVGIVASRIKDEVHRPAAVVSVQGERAVGSVRSVPGVHAVQALTSVSDLLMRFGGHPMAAGFTVATADLDALRERLGAWVLDHTTPEDLVPVRTVDAEVPAAMLVEDLRRALDSLGPFGKGNPRPALLVRGVRATNVGVRAGGRLLRFLIPREGRGGIPGIWWGRADLAERFSGEAMDLVGHLDVDRRYRRLQLEVKDARPTPAE